VGWHERGGEFCVKQASFILEWLALPLRECLVPSHNLPSQSLAIWFVFLLHYHSVIFLPIFATLCGVQFLSHTFVVVTLANHWLRKMWLGTKHLLNMDLWHHVFDFNQKYKLLLLCCLASFKVYDGFSY
jgi:hypothetical protein